MRKLYCKEHKEYDNLRKYPLYADWEKKHRNCDVIMKDEQQRQKTEIDALRILAEMTDEEFLKKARTVQILPEKKIKVVQVCEDISVGGVAVCACRQYRCKD